MAPPLTVAADEILCASEACPLQMVAISLLGGFIPPCVQLSTKMTLNCYSRF